MTPKVALATSTLLSDLIASDEVYFRLAARTVPLPHGELVYTPDLIAVPAACVVQAVEFQGSAADAEKWVCMVESEVRAVGGRVCRVYLREADQALASVFASRGYRQRTETAFCEDPRHLGLTSKVRFKPTLSDLDWAERRRMHEEAPDNSDGYETDPAAWCELMRRKCETGVKESFLIEYEGRICGSIGAIQMPGLLRLKNIIIRPAFRRQGLAAEAVRELAALTHSRGLGALGVFGIEGDSGASLYAAAGFSVIGAQIEWSRRL